MIVYLFMNNATVDGQTIGMNITYPDGTTTGGVMTDEGSGIYSYDFSDTNQTGEYMWIVTYHEQSLIGASVFTVSVDILDIEENIILKIEDSEDDIKDTIEIVGDRANAGWDAFVRWWNANSGIILALFWILAMLLIIYFGRNWYQSRERKDYGRI